VVSPRKLADQRLMKKSIPVVRERSGDLCEVRLPGCFRVAANFHHRLERSQGGKSTPQNLIHVCTGCHGKIHANPACSYAQGWLIHMGGDPDEVAWYAW
jgi:hypothetical protein